MLKYSGGSLAVSLSGLCARLGLRRTLVMGWIWRPTPSGPISSSNRASGARHRLSLAAPLIEGLDFQLAASHALDDDLLVEYLGGVRDCLVLPESRSRVPRALPSARACA